MTHLFVYDANIVRKWTNIFHWKNLYAAIWWYPYENITLGCLQWSITHLKFESITLVCEGQCHFSCWYMYTPHSIHNTVAPHVRGTSTSRAHADVIKWKHFPRYWPFLWGIHRSPVNSRHKGQWRGALMFSLICAWLNGWVNNREASDLRRHRAHYDVIVMILSFLYWSAFAYVWRAFIEFYLRNISLVTHGSLHN